MPATINKQPVFTNSPILVSRIVDPPINTGTVGITALPPTTLFTSNDTFGSLIERVTVSATGDTTVTTVNAKLIYLCIYDDIQTSWSLYKTAAMPARTISDTTTNPEIEWVFTGGLLLPLNYRLGIAASVNSNSGNANQLAITIEGSSYTQV